MKTFSDLMNKAKEAEENLKRMQESVDKTEVTGIAGGGMVTIVMTCKGDIKKIDIDDSLIVPSDKAVLEDLLAAAYNDARAKSEEIYARELNNIKGALSLPF